MAKMNSSLAPLAVVTGASSGIGLELAKCCAQKGFDLVIAADQGPLQAACDEIKAFGVQCTPVPCDLATPGGVDALINAIGTRPVDALLANAGHGLGHGFLDQDFEAVKHVVNTNITGTLDVIQRIGRGMRDRGNGRILLTGSIAGFMPGSFQAVYNASKSFIDSFSYALRDELKDSGVTITVLMPGVTDTRFFERAGLMDTKVGAEEHKADPAEVAKAGFDAMMDGESDVIAGVKNKLQAALSNITPAEVLARQHRKMAEPGSAPR
jgi:short-subunit dehydrogenase